MNIAAIREKLRRTGFFIPFRLHLLLLVIALLLAWQWLRKNNAIPETSRTAIIDVFITVTFWFALVILAFSFLTVFVPWILFLFSKKKQRSSLQIKTPDRDLTNKQQVNISVSHIIRPLFGYIRLRLVYDGENISPKFAPIAQSSKINFFRTSLNGVYAWPLKHIKEYDISKGIIYFEDFFQFFSFTSQLSATSSFFTHPLNRPSQAIIVQPRKTEETNLRIEELRKVQGEFLNYKNFENNDDVRRIVWKIYAKNKELVVRIPETNDPYASHIYFYASFYNAVSNDIYGQFNEIFLDNFKTIVWNVYEQLHKQNAFLQFIPDQETKTIYADDALQKVKFIISTSSWQKQNDLITYFNKQYASLLCISSLTDANQLAALLEKQGTGLTIVFAELGKSFNNVHIIDWLKWIFVKPAKKSSEKLQLAFNLSPLRRKITENEKLIKEILNKSDCEVVLMDA